MNPAVQKLQTLDREAAIKEPFLRHCRPPDAARERRVSGGFLPFNGKYLSELLG